MHGEIQPIEEDVLHQERLLGNWSELIERNPPSRVDWSTDLLCAISKLWSTIRIHAFAQGWSEKFEDASKRGTRKTLKARGTEKESK